MELGRCPGQDRRSWTPDDVYDIECPRCGAAIEYFKDDRRRRCPQCGAAVLNPRFDDGCARWCAAAESCSIMRGVVAEEPADDAPPG